MVVFTHASHYVYERERTKRRVVVYLNELGMKASFRASPAVAAAAAAACGRKLGL